MKVLLEYPTHHYWEEYTKQTDIHCPTCASKNIWRSKDGDCYVGETYLCEDCFATFNLFVNTISPEYKNIIYQLKSGRCFEPKTPKGS